MDLVPWTELGATGALIAMAGYMLTRGLHQFRRLEATQIILTISLMDTHRTVLSHDLTVRGLNPDTNGTLEERDSRAVAVYREVLGHLDRREARLNSLLERLAE